MRARAMFLLVVLWTAMSYHLCAALAGGAMTVEEEGPWILNPVNGHYYRLTESMSWYQAEDQASQWGGHLATINDREEELWLRAQFGADEYFWIGLNDLSTEGVWRWISGEPVTYTNWWQWEPNNEGAGGEIEDAVIMNWGGGENIGGEWFYYYGDGWNDNSVDNEYQGIVEKAKVPWILIHGWDAGPDKWATFEGFLEGDAIPYATVDLRPDADPNVRARTLAQKIDLLREQYRYHGKINLVCHSQGGLDARAYLRNLGGKANDQVYSLTMIATPNHGTRGATLRNWYAILTRMTPLPDKKSTPWLTPGWVEQFNKGTPLMAGVNYYTVAGLLKYSPFSLKKDRFGSLVLPGGDDGVVPVRSVLIDGPNVEHLGTFPYGHNELVARREVYDAVKQKIDPAYAEELDSLAFGAVEDGEVLAGQSASRSVIVDEVNEVAFMVISSGPLDFTLQSPSGESIAPQSLDASVIYDSGNWLDLQAQAYVVQKPISGVWKINVTGGAEPDYFLLLVSAENTFVLDGATDEYFNPVGGKVRLGATLDANASITDMRVEITDPNGSREIVALYDDGLHDDDLPDDGLYGNAFSPSLEGDYTLVFSAKGAIGDREFSRADLESIFVSPQTVPAQ